MPIRKHKGIIQTGKNKGKLRSGYKYSGKKTKTGLRLIVKKTKSIKNKKLVGGRELNKIKLQLFLENYAKFINSMNHKKVTSQYAKDIEVDTLQVCDYTVDNGNIFKGIDASSQALSNLFINWKKIDFLYSIYDYKFYIKNGETYASYKYTFKYSLKKDKEFLRAMLWLMRRPKIGIEEGVVTLKLTSDNKISKIKTKITNEKKIVATIATLSYMYICGRSRPMNTGTYNASYANSTNNNGMANYNVGNVMGQPAYERQY